MDNAKALEKCRDYLKWWEQAEEAHKIRGGRDVYDYLESPAYKEAMTQMNLAFGTIEKIANEVNPDIATRLRSKSKWTWPNQPQKTPLEELIGLLQSVEDNEELFGPEGPTLSAGKLHPWVWKAAAKLWDDGHRPQAVISAASAIFDVELPAKMGVPRGPSAAGFVGQIFSTKDPTATDPRLRFPGLVKGSPDWTNAHEGAGSLGRACAMGIRNVTTHGSHPDEQLALEALAALSLLARWIDEATVETAP
jgi:hypothetical protein